MLFTRPAILEGKLDSALASTHLANINIAKHTPEVTHNKTLTSCHCMVEPSRIKRSKLIIPLTYRGYTGSRTRACRVALTRSTGRAWWQLDGWRHCKQKRAGEKPREPINPLSTSICHSGHAAWACGVRESERGRNEERAESQEWNCRNQMVGHWENDSDGVEANIPDSKHMIISFLVY